MEASINIHVKEISKEEISKIVSEFAHKDENTVLSVDEIAVANLFANEKVVLVETESLDGISPELICCSFNPLFKCCLITMPDSFTLEMLDRVKTLFPTEKTAIGIKKSEKFGISFLLGLI